jgi:hypothetical protein
MRLPIMQISAIPAFDATHSVQPGQEASRRLEIRIAPDAGCGRRPPSVYEVMPARTRRWDSNM